MFLNPFWAIILPILLVQQVLSLATARSYGYCAKQTHNYYGGNDYVDKYYDHADYSEYSQGYGPCKRGRKGNHGHNAGRGVGGGGAAGGGGGGGAGGGGWDYHW